MPISLYSRLDFLFPYYPLSVLCGGTHWLSSSLSLSINPICCACACTPGCVCVCGCPLICTFSALNDGTHVESTFQGLCASAALCEKRSNTSCSKCFGYICAFPVFAFQSRTRGTSVHLFCSQMLVSLRINFPIAGTLPPSVSSISAPCTFERTCDSDGSGRLSILLRPAVGRR